MKKVFTRLPSSSAIPLAVRRAQDMFVLMFLLRGLPFVDLAYLRKSDLRDNVITYRRRKTGRPLSVTLTPEALELLKKYMNRDSHSPYLFSLLKSGEGTKEAYREYQLALRSFNQQLTLLGEVLGLNDKLSSYTARHTWLQQPIIAKFIRVLSPKLWALVHQGDRDLSKPFRNKKIDEANNQIIDFVKHSIAGVVS